MSETTRHATFGSPPSLTIKRSSASAASGIAGYFGGALSAARRAVLIVGAALLFYPGRDVSFAGVGLSVANAAGFVILVIVIVRQFGRKETVP